MQMIMLHDKDEILSFLQKNVFLHIYGIGDLDDFFWNYTTWYALKQNGIIKAIILLYTGVSLPVILALSDDLDPLNELLRSVMHLLPNQFYSHLSPGTEKVMEERFHLKPHGEHYKMGLKNNAELKNVDVSDVFRLSKDNLADILQLYETSYPGNWFDSRMLDTNQYFGLKKDTRLVSISGIHVYSEQFKVAALGNITTHPEYRGQGFGKATTAKLCLSLAKSIDHIGLNVKSDNHTAISLYEKLGFEIICPYGEYMVESK